MRRVPKEYILFIDWLLTNRHMQLKFVGFTSDWIDVDNSIVQGDPLSMILYLFYNADLLEDMGNRALHELICGSPVSEPAGWINMKEPYLDLNRFKCRITCQMGQYRGSPMYWPSPHVCRMTWCRTYLLALLCPSMSKHCRHEIPWHQSHHCIFCCRVSA